MYRKSKKLSIKAVYSSYNLLDYFIQKHVGSPGVVGDYKSRKCTYMKELIIVFIYSILSHHEERKRVDKKCDLKTSLL
jgi:hypothetical protein